MGYFDLPNNHGWVVAWQTGETKTLRNGRTKLVTERYYTKFEEEAKRIYTEKQTQGFNVKMFEGFF